ncbi:MAG: UDP-2,3-diacylglucosamine diphosphatase LpxI [Pseudomonadota bacterium]
MSSEIGSQLAPLGLLAGLGDLPVHVAQAAEARGQPVYVLRLKGFVESALDHLPGETVGMGEIGKTVKLFRAAGVEEMCFAGRVDRPDFATLKPDLKGMSLLPRVLAAARKGDDALLRVMIEAFESEGFRVIGADEASSSLLAQQGLIAGSEPHSSEMDDLEKAAHVASGIGALDIGQGAIVCNGLVLCVEAQEGTDAMLERCATLDPKLRGTFDQRRGVLVKRPKPIQERRIDLPTIGLGTVERAAAAGLAGLGVEAGGALVIDLPSVQAAAQKYGVFVYGFPKGWA